jgi:hypothetical protein
VEHHSVSRSPARLAFVCYLRTGIRLPDSAFEPVAAALEAKFNPYHDPENGRFTFGPGGGGSVSDGVYRPAVDRPKLIRTGGSGPPRGIRGIGHNGGPPLDPIELDHVAPGLGTAPAGSIIAIADTLLNLTEPASQMTSAMSLDYGKNLIEQIQAIDPDYRYDSLGFPSTFEGQMNMIDDLRWDRAVAIYGKTGNAEPLQVEAIRFIQSHVNAEYTHALEAALEGRLPPAPTMRMAIGNYMDRGVQRAVRNKFSTLSALHQQALPLRVNAREYDTAGHDLTFTKPDVRVGNLAIDFTLSPKTAKSPQIRGFFNSDFKPPSVAIIRPAQLGPKSSYIIKRPGK